MRFQTNIKHVRLSSWSAVATLMISAVFFAFSIRIYAESVATSVTVGNSAPAFSVGPIETVSSTATAPTNVGTVITFQATATDSNNEGYYLAICKTNAITPGSSGSAPTCTGGSWCIDTVTASGVQSSCDYTTLVGDAQVNSWYAFVCDNASSSSCSTSSQGTGDSGSPFEVNHAPAFSAISNDSTKNPGQTITWTTTASDPDSTGTADTVKLVVCKTAGISAGDCDGGVSDRWCNSSLVASDPTCGYSIPTPTGDAAYDAFVYVVDNHNFGSASANQGAESDYTVNNIAPVVSNTKVNGDAAINLGENQTTNVDVTATVTDNNSCQSSELPTITASLYRSGVTYANCDTGGDDDSNDCYAVESCTVDVGTCTGAGDSSADYTCTVALKHYADPTDTSTQYTAQNWLATVVATDDDSATHTLESSAGVEVNSLTAMDISASIAFGSLSVGQKNDPLDKTTTTTNTGNVGLDQQLSGTNLTSGGDSIAVAYQKYALAASTAYAAGTALSTTPTSVLLDISKNTTDTNLTKNIWWGLEIPTGTVAGSYSGTNTVTAVKSAFANW